MKLFFMETNIKMRIFLLCIILLSGVSGLLHGQQIEQSTTDHQFPHPLNSTMGIPDPVGSYNVRLNTFHQQRGETGEVDISGHLSYGMFDWGGVHLRSLGVRTTPFTEIIGMVGVWRDTKNKNGVSLLGIVGVPTGKDKTGKQHHGVAYLFGVTNRLTLSDRFVNDGIFHYDFSAKHFIVETGSVFRLTHDLFGGLDMSGTFGNSLPEITVLPSIKMRMFDRLFLALGYNTAITRSKPFAHQIFLQLEVGTH